MRLAACGVVGKLIAQKEVVFSGQPLFLYPHWEKTENFYKKYTYIW